MALEPIYNLLLGLTIVLLIFKLLISVYFGKIILKKRKESGKISFDFTFGMFILMVCLFLSRLVFLFYDFTFTQFNPQSFADPTNILVWKIAMSLYFIGFTTILFAIDKKVLDFKLKGILAYIMLAIIIIIDLYPVSTLEDFIFISTLSGAGLLVAIVIPVIFFYIGIKTPGLRKTAYSISFGVILFGIGALLLIQSIMEPLREAFGTEIQILMFILFFIFKITGLSLFSYGVTKFSL